MAQILPVLLQGLMQGGAIVLVGAAWATAALSPELAKDAPWRRRAWAVLVAAALAALAASLASIPLAIHRVLGRVDLELMRSFLLSTGQGGSVMLRSAMLVAVAALVGFAWRRGARWTRALSVAALLAGLVLADSYARVSHAAVMGGPMLRSFDALHLLAAGAWGGSLMMLALWPWSSRAAPRPALANLSRTGLSAVLLLAATGTVAALQHLRAPAELVTTSYGFAFIAKQCLVAATLLAAAFNRWRLMPRLAALDGPEGSRGIARGLRIEACLLLAVLVATAILTTRPLPHE